MVGINIRLRLENCIAQAELQGILMERFERQHRLSDPNNPRAMLDCIQNFLALSSSKLDQVERELAEDEFDLCRQSLMIFIGDCVLVGAGSVIPTCMLLRRTLYDLDQSTCLPLLAGVKQEYTRLVETLNQIIEMEAELVEHHNLRSQWRRDRQQNDD